MSSGIVILGLMLTGLTGAFVLLPLLASDPEYAPADRPRGTPRQNQALEMLLAEKLRVLRAIRDLDFDYDMGKLSDSIYTNQRVYLIRLAVAIMQRTDDLEAEIAGQEAQLEAAIAALRHSEAQ
jgi:hypothetical protein